MSSGPLDSLYRIILTYRLVLGSIELICFFLYRQIQDWKQPLPKEKHGGISTAIVCATISDGKSMAAALPTWQANHPTEIWIVTNTDAYSSNEKALVDVQANNINLVCCQETNKRAQLCEAFKRTSCDVVVVCDDDTVWSPVVLGRLVQPFQADMRLGAVFPEVKFRPGGQSFTFWETLSAIRLSGDAIDIRTSMLFDGGVFCASGTTAAYRGTILRDPKFLDQFPNETWLGRKLNAGDDQSLTLWLANHDWKCHVIADEGSSGFTVLTTPRTDWKHLAQLVRWSRSDWQACLNATLSRKAIWRNHPFTAWTRLTWCMESFSFIVEAVYLSSLWQSQDFVSQVLLLQGSRLIRYVPDCINFPSRLAYLPVVVLYLYIYQIIRVYSLFTISNTTWS